MSAADAAVSILLMAGSGEPLFELNVGTDDRSISSDEVIHLWQQSQAFHPGQLEIRQDDSWQASLPRRSRFCGTAITAPVLATYDDVEE